MKVQAVLAEETFKSKCIQLITLAFVTFLVMCQIGFVKFPGAWSLREPFFYESPEFLEYIFYVLLATILCVYLVHLLPVYFGCFRDLLNALFHPTNWKNRLQWLRTNWSILLQWFILCVATVSPYISLCDDSAFRSSGIWQGEGGGGNNPHFLIMLAYLLRFFHLWRLPPDTLVFDGTAFMLGLKLGLQHLWFTMAHNIGSLGALILMLRNQEYFPGLASYTKAFAYLAKSPSEKLVQLLEKFQQTNQHIVSVENVWIVSFFIVCLWSWVKSSEKKKEKI